MKRTPSRTTHPPAKKARNRVQAQVEWPEYFSTLFKLYKTINTVLAFLSSRKALGATTFQSVRSAVEDIIKEPLDLARVGELKALMPQQIKFAYVPSNEVRIHEGSVTRPGSPDFSGPSTSRQDMLGLNDRDHILMLEFPDNWSGQATAPGQLSAPSRTPAATKRLIEKRNGSYCQAVDDLLLACSTSGEDPVELIKTAGRGRIPLDPGLKDPNFGKEVTIPIPSSTERQSVNDVLTELQAQDWYHDQISYRRSFPAKEGEMLELDPPLSTAISQALRDSRNINSLYVHQTKAIQALGQGRNIIVATPTASGKSVIYQVPVLKLLNEDPHSTAIFVYPTKALAQDQVAALQQLLCACPGLEHVKVSTYDGDTPQENRQGIRENASVIFTNFDMIHVSILPHEDLWRIFLKNLKLFVVDELHYYSGLFSSHVAYIMRRLRRLCAAVGNRRTRFVSCSATIASPVKHMGNIFGLDCDSIQLIADDSAPSGPREFMIWSTSRQDSDSPITEATRLMQFLMTRGIRVILFCKYRKVCELAMKSLVTSLSSEGRYDMIERIKSYRGGYSPEDRRDIEHQAFTGHLLGLIATNALELGVDIGSLDAVIMLGFPNTLASFRQQLGRAGRRSRDSLGVLVCSDQALDGHYRLNPEQLFEQPTDELLINLDSKVILEAHLQCAAEEMPISLEDCKYFGPLLKEVCETRLVKDSEGWYHTNPKFLPHPSRFIAIRGIQQDTYVLVDCTRGDIASAKILEEIEYSRALFEVYEGAVYLHQGMTFVVTDVNHDSRTAKLMRADVNWITKPRDFTDVDATQTHRIREIKHSPHRTYYGRVDIRTLVFGFHKIRADRILDTVDLETDPWDRESTGMWLDVPNDILDMLKEATIHPAAAIHAAEHAFLNQFSMGQDVRTECKAIEKEVYSKKDSARKRPARLIFYDIIGQGGGITAKAFDIVSQILSKAHDTVERCDCSNDSGCPKCIQSPTCKELNKVSSRRGCLIILKALIGREIDLNSIPMWAVDEELLAGEYVTVVEARPVLATGGMQVDVEPASP